MRIRSLYTAKRAAELLFALGAVLLLARLVGCVYIDHNFRTVEEAALYRSGQLPAQRLEKAIQQEGIRTVISLRHPDTSSRWYREEREACENLAVAHHDLPWSKDKLPEPESLAQFVEWCRTAERPILVHCQGGVHRSGVASAIFLLLQGASPAEARKQLGPFFDDAPIGKVLDLYDGKKPFGKWVVEDYPARYAESVPAAGGETPANPQIGQED